MRHHAEFHDKIRPYHGWDFVTEDDLGDLDGTCEVCGTSIRYVFYIDHPRWPSVAVGTDCCDRMTGTRAASELRLKWDRKKRFYESEKWEQVEKGVAIERMKMRFQILHDQRGHYIQFVGKNGKKRYSSLNETKEALFEFIDSGDARRFQENCRKSTEAVVTAHGVH